MPVEVEKEVTSESHSGDADHVSHTETVAHVHTDSEIKDAHSDRGNAWVWYVVAVIDLVLALRVVFHLFGARAVGFADVLYNVTGWLTAPFKGIFPNPQIEKSYFDMAAIAAIAVYALVGWAISRLIDLATRPVTSKKV